MTFSTACGMQLVERVHAFVALNFEKLVSNFSLLNEIMVKTFQQFLKQLIDKTRNYQQGL